MLKKRLVFTLLLRNEAFQLSRNFSLQSVGKLDWLRKHYDLAALSRSIDELVVLNVTRGEKRLDTFCNQLARLSEQFFMPISAGGGIFSPADAAELMKAGADKLVVCSSMLKAPALVRELVRLYGSQCVVGAIDYRRNGTATDVVIRDGQERTGYSVFEVVRLAQELGVGELYVTSVEKDGTGQGYDLEILAAVAAATNIPIIASGGVGDFKHLSEGLALPSVTGASTANLFNFMGDGLRTARRKVEESGCPLAVWDFDGYPATVAKY